MSCLTASDFSVFFREIHGYEPFPWQAKLAQRACAGDWPAFIAAPTGSGKTAALDAAVFALAVQASLPSEQRTVGRRVFYVVNRRIIVDEAFERARIIAAALAAPKADQPTVARVATALQTLSAAGGMPLDCVQLRGGIYRDSTWVRSATQPLIACATVDQIGSRLLFRGYGVSASSWPLHAALTANDALLLLDEAHISRPFAQTLAAIKRYRSINSSATPFGFVQMTATPPTGTNEEHILRLADADRAHAILAPRLSASKPAILATADKKKLADKLAAEAERLLGETNPSSLAIIVNRVATARAVADKLKERNPALLIGRMRPLDRDDITRDLQAELRTRLPAASTVDAAARGTVPRIVVATQCLEVGADFDFDALVTECAPLDALRQRFGRLNRAGRSIPAHAAIVLPAEASDDDPIYGPAIKQTWDWLAANAANGAIDFGLEALAATITDNPVPTSAFTPTTDAPLLLPAHLDALCQTAPAPTPQPDIALFLHGLQRTAADIQICWRNDLGANLKDWPDILALAPPLSLETLPVPLHQFRQWLFDEKIEDTGDTLDAPAAAPTLAKQSEASLPSALVWRGPDESFLLTAETLPRLRPGDTVIIPSQTSHSTDLGHIPDLAADASVPDLAERAYAKARRQRLIRLAPTLLAGSNASAYGEATVALLAYAKDHHADIRRSDLIKILQQAATEAAAFEAAAEEEEAPLLTLLKSLSGISQITGIARYPGGIGLVITAPAPYSVATDRSGSTFAAVTLERHLADVLQAVRKTLARLPLAHFRMAFETAAAAHDWGKADERFQALLLGGDLNLAYAQSAILAKSATQPASAAAYEAARRRTTLPKGFRHEMLSAQLLEAALSGCCAAIHADCAALAVHLVASHHGHARPFAPIVIDEIPPSVELPPEIAAVVPVLAQQSIVSATLDTATRLARPAHRLDSGIAERFWQLTRRHGWWGLAYLESVLRLTDWQASAKEGDDE